MSIFRKLFGSKKAKSDQLDDNTNHQEENHDEKMPFNFDNYLKVKLIRFEATYRYQPFVFRRASEENRITLGEVLDELQQIKKNEIRSLLVLTRQVIANSLSKNRIDDIDEIYSFDLFKGFQQGVNDGHYTEGRSFDYALIVFSKDKNIYVNLTPLGGSKCIKFVRVSICVPDSKIQEDDLRSFQGKHNPLVSSFVLSFVEDGYKEELAYFETIERSATLKQQKGENLDEIEQEYIHGKFEFKGYDYIGYGKWLFNQSRYYDTIATLTRAYNFMRPSVHHYEQNLLDIFQEVCLLLAKCYYELRQREKAWFYCQIAAEYTNTWEPFALRGKILSDLGNASAMTVAEHMQRASYIQDYGEDMSKWPKGNSEVVQTMATYLKIHKQNYDYFLKQNPTVNGIITIGELLNVLLGIERSNILPSMAIIDNNSHDVEEMIDENEKIYDFVLNIKTCQNKSLILALTHSHARTESDDQSILCHYATLLIATHCVKQTDGRDLMRVDIMRPNFNQDDDKNDLEFRDNRPFKASVILGFVSEDTYGASKDECIKCNAYAQFLMSQNRFVEAAKFSKWSFNNANHLIKDDNGLFGDIDDEILNLCFDSAYNLGFCLMEIEQTQMSLYYLEIAKQSHSIERTIEYINCLTYAKSPLALKEINELFAIESSPKTVEEKEAWENFQAFLKRRKAYTLIDLKEYGEARSFLAGLLDDPKCKDFALNEINYLNSIERR